MDKPDIVFFGSSILNHWKTLDSHLSMYRCTNYAVAGSKTTDQLKYLRWMQQNRPNELRNKYLVYYCGGNDICTEKNITKIASNIKTFINTAITECGVKMVCLIDVMECPSKKVIWNEVKNLNNILNNSGIFAFHCNINDSFPKDSIYYTDGLHLTNDAYDIFAKILRNTLSKMILSYKELESFSTGQYLIDHYIEQCGE